MFSERALRETMHPIFVQQTELFISILGSKGKGVKVDINDLFFRFTMDAMSQVA